MAYFTAGKDPDAALGNASDQVPSSPGREVPHAAAFRTASAFGDVNGDGRLDVICTGGWWEQARRRARSGQRRSQALEVPPRQPWRGVRGYGCLRPRRRRKADILSSSPTSSASGAISSARATATTPSSSRPTCSKTWSPKPTPCTSWTSTATGSRTWYRQALVVARPQRTRFRQASMLYWFEPNVAPTV